MIDLTPVDVRKKKGDFKRSIRGYESNAVDQFLELVADRMEELLRQTLAQNERVAQLEAQVTGFRDRERALTEALVTAQEVREEVKRQAERSAELLRREAEADAEQLRQEAIRQRDREEDALRRMRTRREQFLRSYKRHLEQELADLETLVAELNAAAEVEGEPPPARTRFAAGRLGGGDPDEKQPGEAEGGGFSAQGERPGSDDDPGWLSSLMEEKP